MCGIAGFANREWDKKDVIEKMNAQMLHRGPDAGGYWWDDTTGMTFGHRRLSIVDLSENGAQPMLSHDERYVLVYNGEIYNAGQLKEKLIKEGFTKHFKGTSDTEIMLEGFCAYGVEKTLSFCKGMFAIALYDRETKRITLARDRIGEKPLYYGYVNGIFVFASDLAVIRAVPGFQNPLSKRAVRSFLRYGYVPAPDSIYKDIFKCRPGHILTAEYPYTEWKDTAYYDLKEEYRYAKEHPFTGDFLEAADGLESVLKEAVKSQMVADVPLGAFLSGGIDSSVIVSLMQSMSMEKVKTFTIGFTNPDYNEADDAKKIAEYLGTDHTSLIITQQELKDVIPQIPSIFSEPFADSSQIPTYLVSKLARSKVTVSLSGDAGDELFCGYNTYWKVANLYRKLQKVPGAIKTVGGRILTLPGICENNNAYRAGKCFQSADIANLHESVCYDTAAFSDKLLTSSFLESQKGNYFGQTMLLTLSRGSVEPEDEMMLRDLLTYHPDDILVKVDRAGMAVSLENRVPMLDKDVLSFAYALPLSYKYGVADGKGISKRILKEVLYRYVPKEMMERPKKGFSVPLTDWLKQGSVHEWANEILSDSMLVRDGILNGRQVTKLWEHFLKTGQNKGLLWNVIVLEQWYRNGK